LPCVGADELSTRHVRLVHCLTITKEIDTETNPENQGGELGADARVFCDIDVRLHAA